MNDASPVSGPNSGFVRALLLAWTLLAGACGTTLTSSGPVPVDADARWALLPIDNLSSTPLAGRAAASLVETRLRARGVARVTSVAPEARTGLVALLDDASNRDAALVRARAAGHRYAVAGTVHEWRYRGAPDLDAVVGLSLTLIDVGDGAVLWQGNASRGGWAGASLSNVADKVVGTLLGELRIAPGPAFPAD